MPIPSRLIGLPGPRCPGIEKAFKGGPRRERCPPLKLRPERPGGLEPGPKASLQLRHGRLQPLAIIAKKDRVHALRPGGWAALGAQGTLALPFLEELDGAR